MFSKSERYYYDREAVMEDNGHGRRNRRSVWEISTQAFPGSHFATFPPALVRPCVLSSTGPGDFVLDPFFGSGTAGVVAQELGRRYVGIELHRPYVEMAAERLSADEQTIVKAAA